MKHTLVDRIVVSRREVGEIYETAEHPHLPGWECLELATPGLRRVLDHVLPAGCVRRSSIAVALDDDEPEPSRYVQEEGPTFYRSPVAGCTVQDLLLLAHARGMREVGRAPDTSQSTREYDRFITHVFAVHLAELLVAPAAELDAECVLYALRQG